MLKMAAKKRMLGRENKCTLKVRLQHFWDSLQISHSHQRRHALDQRCTLPPLFVLHTEEKSTSCSALEH